MKAKLFPILLCASAPLWLMSSAHAVDHNNVDANRPLDFDDAESIALHEQDIEVGASFAKQKPGGVAARGEVEYLYGFAPNTHLNIGLDPSFARQNGGRRRFDAGDLSVGVLHNFNREYGNTPAFGVRADAYLPTGRDSRGVDFRLRGIASKSFRQYARVHLNLDLNVNSSPRNGERQLQPGVLLGYSQPLGYPTRFDRTLLAQVGVRANPERGESGIVNVGLGLRQQVTVRSVFDLGLTSDVAGGRNRDTLRLIAGYSTAF